MTVEFAQVEVSFWIPPAVAFGISVLTSTGGISGAFLLLPFQVSVLRFDSPAVSATNQLYNIIAIPGGVYRYIRDRRMLWPLAWTVIAGSAPGVVIGSVLRVEYMPDPRRFKLFAGAVLLYLAVRLVANLVKDPIGRRAAAATARRRARVRSGRPAPPAGTEPRPPGDRTAPPAALTVDVHSWGLRHIQYAFDGEAYRVNTAAIALIGFVVGIIGGVYGIGGGALVVPICVSFMRLPVHSLAGAALFGTFVTSIVAVLSFQVIAVFHPDVAVAPDWRLGLLFGVGGLAGTYCGARVQKYVSPTIIGWILAVSIGAIAVRYVLSSLVGATA